MKLIDIENQ